MRCAIPECARSGKHRLGVRCRVAAEPSPVKGKVKTHALWSVESDAYLCDSHAMNGVDVTLLLEPTNARSVSIRVVGAPDSQARRVPIKQDARKGEAAG
jgi:hypothetical protein